MTTGHATEPWHNWPRHAFTVVVDYRDPVQSDGAAYRTGTPVPLYRRVTCVAPTNAGHWYPLAKVRQVWRARPRNGECGIECDDDRLLVWWISPLRTGGVALKPLRFAPQGVSNTVPLVLPGEAVGPP